MSDPILLGLQVKSGILKVGTPLFVPDKHNMKIGVVMSIQKNKVEVNQVRESDGEVSVKIQNTKGVQAGRHFTEENQLASLINRNSIEALKTHFKDEMTKPDWMLVIRLKTVLGIQ
mmetsp:Transcript_23325/g.20707  ORF Transcript_23325/g.20707 Transcript_23325/m.20707 type:complete len:116 (-) Transcript_23325:63-410(-)